MAKKKKSPVAILRDGVTEIRIGDEVETDIHEKCAGVIFVVYEINPYDVCDCGFMVKIHVKDHPERKYKSLNELGIDANWLRKIKS